MTSVAMVIFDTDLDFMEFNHKYSKREKNYYKKYFNGNQVGNDWSSFYFKVDPKLAAKYGTKTVRYENRKIVYGVPYDGDARKLPKLAQIFR